MEIRAVFDSGAYGAFKPIPDLNLAGAHTAGGIAYHVPHIKIDSYCVYTNNVPCGHVRGPGYPQICFAIESQIDIIAKSIGIDPVEMRMRNLFDKGDEPLFGGHWENVKAKETLQRAVQASGWRDPKARPYIGRGLAIMQKSPGVSPTGANIAIDSSGHVTLRMGIPEQGSGSHTIARQIIAQELQIPLDLVSVETGSTDYTPDSGWGAGASSVTHCLGQAVLLAVKEARTQLLKDAAGLLQIEEQAITLENCNFAVRASEKEMQIPFQELVSRLVAKRGGAYDITKIYDWAAGNKGAYSFSGVTSFCAQVAEVEVDPDTGQVSIIKITTAHDIGTVLNPMTHQGQIEGGVLQGIGFAVMEELCVKDGRVSTLHLGDYKIPNIKDIPELVTVLIQEPAGPAPYQGKSIGEIGTVPIPAAVANAICDATGVRLLELPQSAEKIYRALNSSGTGCAKQSSTAS